MLGNGRGSGGDAFTGGTRVTMHDYKPLLCECGGKTFGERVFYTLMTWRIGAPPVGVPLVMRVRGLEMVCEGCGKVMPAPASDARPA